MREAQENRPSVPVKIEDFNAYLEQLPLMRSIKSGQSQDLYHLLQWNALALDLTAQDHTNIPGVTDKTYAEQYGPHRSSWALAIVHLAMFEAVNAIFRKHQSYKNLQAQILGAVTVPAKEITPKTASVRSALAYAAYGTLTVLYANKTAYSNAVFNRLDLSIQDPDASKALGTKIGIAAAKAVLGTRQYNDKSGAFGDGSQATSGVSSLPVEPTFASLYMSPTPPRDWDVDPVTLEPSRSADIGTKSSPLRSTRPIYSCRQDLPTSRTRNSRTPMTKCEKSEAIPAPRISDRATRQERPALEPNSPLSAIRTKR